MKKLSVLIIICAIAAFCLPAVAEEPAAAEKTFEFGADLQLNSKYMWRGIELNEDPQFQPDVWVKYGGFTLTVWGGMDLTGVHNGPGEPGERGDFSEIDYIIEYEHTFDKFICGLGYIYYDYPHTDTAWTHEVFGSVGYDVLLSPTVTVYYDMKEGDGWYGTFGISHEIPIKTYCTLALSGTIGYVSGNDAKFFYGKSVNCFSDTLLTAALKIPITENITIIPAVNYTALLGSLRGRDINKQNDTFWSGINVALAF